MTRTLILTAALLLAASPSTAKNPPSQSSQDPAAQARAELGVILDQIEAAWDAHDVGAMVAHFTADATFITPDGRLSVGQDEIRAHMQQEHATFLARSNWSPGEFRSLQMITPTVCAATIPVTVTGIEHPSMPQQDTLQYDLNLVAVRDGNGWKFAYVRPTIYLPAGGPGS